MKPKIDTDEISKNNKILVLLRGVAGSGKSTFGNLINNLVQQSNLSKNNINHSADRIFEDRDGNYNFNPKLLGYAHKECIENVETSMIFEEPIIVVSNTSTKESELKSYIDLATQYNYCVFSLIVENRHGNQNIHNVPSETLVRQELNLRNSLKLR